MLCIPSSCVMERGGWKPNVEISPTCPRCGSTNTKFCYYNNYCLTQPRYFCKGCRRYWTRGGSLRNVPIGGGCRKSRRSKPMRVSTDHGHGGVSSRGLSGLGRHGNQLAEASSSMPGLDGPNNIDLAVVYANFLNQKPQNEADQLEIPQFSNNVGSNFEFSSVHSMHLAQHSGVLECAAHTQILTDGNAIYDHCGLDSIDQNHQVIINPHFTSTNNHTSNYVLPPLPGEELLVSEGMVWPTTAVDAMLHHQMLHVTHSSGLTPEVLNPNPVSGNECPFNLSNYDFSGLGK